MNIKSITIIFENCESVTLDPKDIGLFTIKNVQLDICRVATNAILPMHKSNCVVFSLKWSANKPFVDLAGKTDYLLFERLTRYYDITAIEIQFADKNEHYTVYPDYSGGTNNKYQTVGIDKTTKELCVAILNNGETIRDYLRCEDEI